MSEYIYVLGMDGRPQMPTKRKRHIDRLLSTGCERLEEEFGEHIHYCSGRDTARLRRSFGFHKTKETQIHEVDAWCIGIVSLNDIPERCPDFTKVYQIKQFRRQNRSRINN